MRTAVYLLTLFIYLSVGPADAGAWLREKGKSFSSNSFTLNRLKDHTTGTYLEYGLRDDLTIGADVSFASSHLGLTSGAVTLFLRRPIGPADRTHKFSYEIGAGTAWVSNITLPHLKLGLSWGRGIKIGEKYGWANIDTAMFWEVSEGKHLIKVDGTLGLHFSELLGGMLQIYYGRVDSQSFTTVAPSILIKPRKRKYRVQVGTETLLGSNGTTALKLGIWHEF